MKHAILTSLLLILSTSTISAQTSNSQELINKIKLDQNYVYGEATMDSEADAKYLAFDFLFMNLKDWIASNSDNVVADILNNDKIEENDEIVENSLIVTTPRRDMQRVFVYFDLDLIKIVKKSDVSVANEVTDEQPNKLPAQSTEGSESTPANEVATNETENNKVLTDKEIFEQELAKINNVSELVDFFTQDKYYNRCKYGEVNEDALKRIDIKNAYLLLYTPGNNEVVSVLSYYHNGRINFKTGYPDSTINHKGCKAIWVTY